MTPRAGRARRVLALALILAACGRRGDADGDGANPSDSAAAADTSGLALLKFAAGLPDSLLHRAGACPFECCAYGTWTGVGVVALRPEPRRAVPKLDTIPAGEPFTADSGFVRLTGVSVLVIQDTVNVGPTTFRPGDTIAVLDYRGEGFFNVWDGRQLWQVEDFWGGLQADPAAGLAGGGKDGREWWVHATTRAGKKGWIDADSVAIPDGADRCA